MSAQPATPPSTAQQHAVAWLRRAIVAGELRPGDRVPQEEMAGRMGVSMVPVREALRVLEGEGQVTYLPRRGYFVTQLRMGDLREIYALRELLEERAARRALAALDAEVVERMAQAARRCAEAAAAGDVAAELEANRRFHFALLDACEQPHLLRLLRHLWDSTEAYRALYYNVPDERRAADDAHERILAAVARRDADAVVAELDAHRARALDVLGRILEGDA
ncbi:MAG: GntR family transcriptional regulator [Actinobacteria bacterium]|nr:GntR family transcriptional regulator [Actinomycetota bacterium]